MSFDILFQNKNFLIVNKPAGYLTVPSRMGKQDPRPVLGFELQDELKKADHKLQLYPVHRLDYEVAGLVMFAKNESAHRLANDWFEHKKVRKHYYALTSTQSFSHWPDKVANPREIFTNLKALNENSQFEWRNQIEKGKRRAFQSPRGKTTLTQAALIGFVKNKDEMSTVKSRHLSNLLNTTQSFDFLFWDLQPVTGRSHQLRFELSFRGFPILGDHLYGSSHIFSQEETIALESYLLDFSLISDKDRAGLPEKHCLYP